MSKKPTWKRIEIILGDIDLYEHNPRFSTEGQAGNIAGSEDKFGQPIPMLVSPTYTSEKGKGRVLMYDGHQRYYSWLAKYGPDMIVEANQCSRALTEDEIQELIITLHAGATGSWNWDKLANWDAKKLIKWGFDKNTMKQWRSDTEGIKFVFESALLDKIPDEVAPPEIEQDQIKELAIKWKVTQGDVFRIGSHRIMCGDSTNKRDVEILLQQDKPDISVTDPPYNVGKKYTGKTNDKQSKEDFIKWCKLWARYMPKRMIMTVGIKRLLWWDDILGDPQWIISWVKRNGQGQTGLGGTNKWDAILCYGLKPDNQPDSIEINNDYSDHIKAEGFHPTAKPVELCVRLIERFNGRIIYEPFNGTGTVMVASEHLGRTCLSMEIEPAYVAYTLERMTKEYPGIEVKRL